MERLAGIVRPVDRRIWAREIEWFAPERVFDAHFHLMEPANTADPKERRQFLRPFSPFSGPTGAAEHRRIAQALFPRRTVRALFMPFPTPSLRVESDNAFTADEAAKAGAPALMIVTPGMSAGTIESFLDQHPNVIGLKPYLFYSTNRKVYDSRPCEFITAPQVAVAHRRGLVIMFHMARQLCMADPLNRKDILQFNRRYPNARWILAHCARGYIPWTLRESLKFINSLRNTWLDTSGVTSYETFDVLFSGIPNERILFGSDNGILRGQTVELGETWTVVTERTLASAIAHTSTEPTLKLYEELRAMARAARRNRLSRHEIKNIFWNNAVALTAAAGRLGNS